MTRAQLIRTFVAALIAGAGLRWMRSFGALQWPSVAVYSGLVIVACGVLSTLLPRAWTGFPRRVYGLLAGLLVGGAMLTAGLLWPARSHTISTPVSRLDAFMPVYDFEERHEITIHAPGDRVREAFDRVSFADIGVMQTLGKVRAVAMGLNLKQPSAQAAAVQAVPIAQMIRSPRSGFFPLDDTPREFVFGLAGQPWDNRGVRLTAGEFREWASPGNIKVAANLRMEDAGDGRTRVITETRVLASDEAARSQMAKYWALIYPGSGMVRRSLLEAIRDRAERP